MKKLINTCQTIVLLIVIVVNVQAQSGSDCPNLDFSLGNFTNWVCKTSIPNMQQVQHTMI